MATKNELGYKIVFENFEETLSNEEIFAAEVDLLKAFFGQSLFELLGQQES